MSETILGTVNGHVDAASLVAERIMRLDCSDMSSWYHFPRYIDRCLVFAQQLLGFNQMQLANFEQDLRNRWATPHGSLFIAVLDNYARMVGHILGWVNVDYGQPYLFNFQAEMDDGYSLLPIVDKVFAEHVEYIGWANAMYEKAGQKLRIDKVRTQTMRNADAIVRYLRMKGIEGVVERTVIGWKVE